MPAAEQPIPSVWTRPRRTREQPALSREQIVAEAVRLLDAEGVEALSMRKLGTRLDAGATSLYRHVGNKDELIELVVDEVYGELEVPEAGDPADWRAAVAGSAHGLRAMALRHPWVTSVLGQAGLSYLGPNLMRMSDRLLALFKAAGFPSDEADQAMKAVIAYVIGAATSEAAYLSMLARSGRGEREFLESLHPSTEEAVQDHPELREGLAAQRGRDPQRVRDENFAYGLERILDGLGTRLGGGASAG
ncbi:TetR family transcriptional regulator [Streptomyces eurocidicus]|uniref:AcrR family transcriptional regulator n=1 Tax=Streptomyces eurocidicus TaxID=66423 RepID=A0A2N8NPR3_STREU|nr:TetR/AcrR family transcriptional regulator [Streptomyces eurocidicus]MBB5119487.1 AcrR family transcriptional regulator [Streptomyces eurocidicus]MBF6054362.1 TetR family transcriptional regulator [Streptomyces eurocidicus]PNE30754.1 TetR family transcriptional regulator [Streptomyces eurocidicus]